MNILILTLYAPTKTKFSEGIGGAQEVIYQLGKMCLTKLSFKRKMVNNI